MVVAALASRLIERGRPSPTSRREKYGYAAGTVISIALVAAALGKRAEFDITEVLGFVSGALCVWLTVKEDVWNFPVSIANNIFFVVLFLNAKLFADMGLQVVYVVLELLGWYWWLRGGQGRTALAVWSALGSVETPVVGISSYSVTTV